jgi:hypothetical protein
MLFAAFHSFGKYFNWGVVASLCKESILLRNNMFYKRDQKFSFNHLFIKFEKFSYRWGRKFFPGME